MGPLAVSEVAPKSATKCAGNRRVDAKLWRGTYRGTVVYNGYIVFVFNVKESLGGNHEYSKPSTARSANPWRPSWSNPSIPADTPVVSSQETPLRRSSFRLRLPDAIAEADREDGKEAGVAETMIVAHFERGDVLLEARILTDRLAAHRR